MRIISSLILLVLCVAVTCSPPRGHPKDKPQQRNVEAAQVVQPDGRLSTQLAVSVPLPSSLREQNHAPVQSTRHSTASRQENLLTHLPSVNVYGGLHLQRPWNWAVRTSMSEIARQQRAYTLGVLAQQERNRRIVLAAEEALDRQH